HVFASQVKNIFLLLNKRVFILMIALGVAFFVTLSLLRTVFHFSFKIILLVSYAVIFLLVFFADKNFIGVAFDAGGATTGPMTVPFIMALGLGVSKVSGRSGTRKDESSENSFGLTGMSSVGPILAVMLYGMIFSHHTTGAENVLSQVHTSRGIFSLVFLIPHYAREAFISLLPIVVLFLVFQFTLLKIQMQKLRRMIFGLLYSFIGLVIFLVGINGGFMETGFELGRHLGVKALQSGGAWFLLLVASGLLIGALVVCAEPAVWILTEQVERISSGTVKRKMLLVCLSIGTAFAIGLSVIRSVYGFSLIYILVPCYALALFLMIFCPTLFTAIAFDSGGVASGPITSTFVLSFTLGVSSVNHGGANAFGVVALVAVTPLIALQIFGIVYNVKKKQLSRRHDGI
ncbi:MAG: DUF1538 family protein, partial [Treponema sp.]|nr:DUF1538 family protein [Treponema sp.]